MIANQLLLIIIKHVRITCLTTYIIAITWYHRVPFVGQGIEKKKDWEILL